MFQDLIHCQHVFGLAAAFVIYNRVQFCNSVPISVWLLIINAADDIIIIIITKEQD